MKNSQQSSSSPADETDGFSSVLVGLTILFLVANAAASGYRARHEPWNFCFVVFCYAMLAALLLCIRLLEKRRAAAELSEAAEGAEGLKAAAWALATLLNVSFTWRVAEMMPLGLAVAAWVLVLVFSVCSLYALIFYRSAESTDEEDGCSYKKKLLLEEV